MGNPLRVRMLHHALRSNNVLRRVRLWVVLLHSVVLIWVIWNVLLSSPDALHQAPWFILFWPDLPATILLLLAWGLLPDPLFVAADATAAAIFTAHPVSSFSNFWLPLLVYATIGTWWWYAVPSIVLGLAKRMRIAR